MLLSPQTEIPGEESGQRFGPTDSWKVAPHMNWKSWAPAGDLWWSLDVGEWERRWHHLASRNLGCLSIEVCVNNRIATGRLESMGFQFHVTEKQEQQGTAQTPLRFQTHLAEDGLIRVLVQRILIIWWRTGVSEWTYYTPDGYQVNHGGIAIKPNS